MKKTKYKTIEEKNDQAIYESEKEVAEGGKPISLKEARQKLDDESSLMGQVLTIINSDSNYD